MAKEHAFLTSQNAAGRTLFDTKAIEVHQVVFGTTKSLNVELTAGVAATFTFAEPVMALEVYPKVDIYLAKDQTMLGVPATGKDTDRIFVAANTRRQIPWFQDDVAYAAVAGGGTIYIEGAL